MRVGIAGLVGAIAMFIWATIAHVATPLAFAGFERLPDEAATIATLHASLGDKPGFYLFPFAAGRDSKSMADQKARMQLGPSGLIAYQPPGAPALMPRQLVVEFVLELVEAVLTAVLLSFVPGAARRIGVAVGVGVVAAISTNFSYWNWYGFSWDYTLATAFTELMKYVVAGVAIVVVLGWPRRPGRAR